MRRLFQFLARQAANLFLSTTSKWGLGTTHPLSSAPGFSEPGSVSLLLILPNLSPCAPRGGPQKWTWPKSISYFVLAHLFPHKLYKERATAPKNSALKSKCNFLSSSSPFKSNCLALQWMNKWEVPVWVCPIQLPFGSESHTFTDPALPSIQTSR